MSKKSVEEIFGEMQKYVNEVIGTHGYIQAMGLVEMLRSVVHGNFEFSFINQRNKQIIEKNQKQSNESEVG